MIFQAYPNDRKTVWRKSYTPKAFWGLAPEMQKGAQSIADDHPDRAPAADLTIVHPAKSSTNVWTQTTPILSWCTRHAACIRFFSFLIFHFRIQSLSLPSRL
jgi:hypothetical protein